MANQEGAGGRIFGITAPTRERTATPVREREKELAPPPTTEEARAANAGEYVGNTRVVDKVGKNRVLKATLGGLGIVGGVVGVGAIAYETVPAIHRLVGSAFLDNIKGFFKGTTFEERFPIVLSKDKFTSVSKEEEQELWRNTKTVDLENHTFTIGFPVDQATIDKSPNLRMNEKFDAILPPFINRDKLIQEGVKNVKTLSGFEKGTEYMVGYDESKYEASVLTIALAGVVQGQGGGSFNPAYTNVTIIYRDRATGKIEFHQTIGGLYADLLVPIKPYPENRGFVYEDGSPIKSGGALLRLTTDLQDWEGKGQVLPDQQGQFVIRSTYQQENPKAPIPLNTGFLRMPNGNIASSR